MVTKKSCGSVSSPLKLTGELTRGQVPFFLPCESDTFTECCYIFSLSSPGAILGPETFALFLLQCGSAEV